MPNQKGHFSFCLRSGITVSDGIDKLIWSVSEEVPYNFDVALQCVHKDFRQSFTDNSLGAVGKKTHVEFELTLNNGNRTREVYEIIGHKDDYKITTNPVFINGTTTLLRKAG